MTRIQRVLLLVPLLALLPLVRAAVAVGGGTDSERAQNGTAQFFDEFHKEIFFAVLEGLYRDGLTTAQVDRIVERDAESGYPVSFVQGCPICMPALDGFLAYRARPHFVSLKLPADTFGDGLDEASVARLTGPDRVQRREALQALVQRWVGERMDQLRLDEAERARWRQAMQERAKKGMALLAGMRATGIANYADFEVCPLCQGAEDATAGD